MLNDTSITLTESTRLIPRWLIVVAVFLAACGGSTASTTTPIQETTLPTTSTSSTSGSVTELTLPEAGILAPGAYSPVSNPLEAGTYTVDTAGVPITFTIHEGWTLQNEAQVGPLWQPDDGIFGFISVSRFLGEVFDDPCDVESQVAIDRSPIALIDWLAANPALDSTPVEEISVGGVAGYRTTVATPSLSDCDPPFLLLWVLPVVGDYHLLPDMRAEFVTVEVEDVVLVLAVEADESGWEATKSNADAFYQSLVIGG